jgi:hypothetical protein
MRGPLLPASTRRGSESDPPFRSSGSKRWSALLRTFTLSRVRLSACQLSQAIQSSNPGRSRRFTYNSLKIQLLQECALTQFLSMTALESAPTKKGVGGARSSLAVTNVQPARAVALPARFLIPAPASQTGRASLPVGLVCGAAHDSGAALARSHLRALASDRLGRVRQRPAARTNGHRLRFLVRSLFRFGFRCLVRHACVVADSESVYFGKGPAMIGPGATGSQAFLQ